MIRKNVCIFYHCSLFKTKQKQIKKNQFREHGYLHVQLTLTVNMVFCRENGICNVFTKFKIIKNKTKQKLKQKQVML